MEEHMMRGKKLELMMDLERCGANKEILIHYNKSKSKAEKLKKDLSKNGTKVYLIKGDLSKETDVNKIVKFAKSKLKYKRTDSVLNQN